MVLAQGLPWGVRQGVSQSHGSDDLTLGLEGPSKVAHCDSWHVGASCWQEAPLHLAL